MKIEQLYTLFLEGSGVCTDTRNIQAKSIFFALKGENFNGNLFAEKAIEAGASYAVVDEQEFENIDKGIFWFPDSLKALQDLAHYHRRQLNTPIIALTGSNGKTTTKELITQVLRKKYKVCATKGNLNNHIGVPLTLLSMSVQDEIGIVEMGANHQKEIEMLTQIAEPDFGYITNFGKAHLEGFGGVEGVIKGKSEMYAYLRAHDKTAFVNAEDPKQLELTQGMKTVSFGLKATADYQYAYSQPTDGSCPAVLYDGTTIQSQLVGQYNVNNVAAAITIGLEFKVPLNLIQEAIGDYQSDNNRSQIIEKNGYTIILDAYNANPSSMEAALRNFKLIEGEKALILGDMFELGESSIGEHQQIADLALELGFAQIYLIGENFNQIQPKSAENIRIFKNRTLAEAYFSKNEIEQKLLLIKGSRGMALEKLLEFF